MKPGPKKIVAAADSAETAAAASGRTVAGKRVDKRLAKRHKRQVLRSREKVKISEPDLRTHEQIVAARLASRPDLRSDKNPWPEPHSDSGTPKESDSSQ